MACHQSRSLPFWRAILPAATLGTLLSLFFTGYGFGQNNNVYHIPYVLKWAQLPAFSDDQFYQTLRYFTSAVWPLVGMIATENNVETVFLAAFILSRLATFVAIAFLLGELGLRQRGQLVLGLLAAAATPWLQGTSALGEHGLLIAYFTHSELTWPFLIGAMLCTLRGQWRRVAVLAALTLSINAFVGIWLLLTLPVCILLQPTRPSRRELFRACLVFTVLAMPISVWILGVLLAPHEVYAFRFSDYIRAFYPDHFLIDTIHRPSITAFINTTVAGILATWFVRNGGFWRVMLLADIALLAAGAILPYIVDHKIVFDMHFLRLGGVIQFFGIILIIAACLNRVAASDRRIDWFVPGLMLAALVSNNRHSIALLLLMLSACHPLALWLKHIGAGKPAGPFRWQACPDHPEPWLAAAALLAWMVWDTLTSRQPGHLAYFFAIALGGTAMASARAAFGRTTIVTAFVLAAVAVASAEHGIAQRAQDARDALQFEQGPLPMAQWLRAHPIRGKLLLSPEAMQKDAFQLRARTSVWVDFKQGAAVLWYPYFYRQWSERYQAVLRLTTLRALADYAREHRIPYFTGRDEGHSCPAGTALVHKEGNFLLCSVAP